MACHRVGSALVLTALAATLASSVTGCGKNGPSGPVTDEAQSTLRPCRVLDPDLADSYEGHCENDLAEGRGTARGRDSYDGEFRGGRPHGTGLYAWGENSKWAGQRYEGDFFGGTRSGFGTLYMREAPTDSELKTNSKLEEGSYVVRGLWANGSLQLACDTLEQCQKKTGYKADAEPDIPARPVMTTKLAYRSLRDRAQSAGNGEPRLAACLAYESIDQTIPRGWSNSVLTKPELTRIQNAISSPREFAMLLGYCFGRIGAGANYEKLNDDPYQQVSLEALLVDLPDMVQGDMVKVSGRASLTTKMIGKMVTLSMEHAFTPTLDVDPSGIPREQKLSLMQRCAASRDDCNLTVYGKVGAVGFLSNGLIADQIEID